MKDIIMGLLKRKIVLVVLSFLFSSVGVLFIFITTIIVFIVLIMGGADQESNNSFGCSTDLGNLSLEKMETVFEPNAKGGVFEGKTKYLIDLSKKHHINSLMFVSILASESGWGKGVNATRQKNPASLMGNSNVPWQFKSIEEGTEAYAKLLETQYINKGLDTPEKIQPIYAPIGASNDSGGTNSYWLRTVRQIMNQLEDKSGGSSFKGSSNICSDANFVNGETLKALKKYHGKLPKYKNSEFNGNAYAYRQCTWYVYNRRLELGLPCYPYFGDGGQWAHTAPQHGYKTGKKPVQGSMVSWSAQTIGNGYGHIAFVESVSEDGKTIHISEYNFVRPQAYSERTLKVNDTMTFIY
ncbi:TPA: CHAP domain-containing protein [Staphylococcus delphini]|nr:CHAP domain-containing protein [Staphylococcus delphini]HEC2183830.1 CHAP domain-containing protein [Staphylococcus delphini]HEC2222279.1 CHAP domain-containing protein [Staphylococcus delphini]HEC2227121.1 CHAP domain-containing protein [Staphylococcus delphini]HEC2232116.1 CHAP domain-containing protein [Staphylococcus delphini]